MFLRLWGVLGVLGLVLGEGGGGEGVDASPGVVTEGEAGVALPLVGSQSIRPFPHSRYAEIGLGRHAPTAHTRPRPFGGPPHPSESRMAHPPHRNHNHNHNQEDNGPILRGSVPVNAYHNPTTGIQDNLWQPSAPSGVSWGSRWGAGTGPQDPPPEEEGEGSLKAALNTLWSHRNEVYSTLEKGPSSVSQDWPDILHSNERDRQTSINHNTVKENQAYQPTTGSGEAYEPGQRPNQAYQPTTGSSQPNLPIRRFDEVYQPGLMSDQEYQSRVKTNHGYQSGVRTDLGYQPGVRGDQSYQLGVRGDQGYQPGIRADQGYQPTRNQVPRPSGTFTGEAGSSFGRPKSSAPGPARPPNPGFTGVWNRGTTALSSHVIKPSGKNPQWKGSGTPWRRTGSLTGTNRRHLENGGMTPLQMVRVRAQTNPGKNNNRLPTAYLSSGRPSGVGFTKLQVQGSNGVRMNPLRTPSRLGLALPGTNGWRRDGNTMPSKISGTGQGAIMVDATGLGSGQTALRDQPMVLLSDLLDDQGDLMTGQGFMTGNGDFMTGASTYSGLRNSAADTNSAVSVPSEDGWMSRVSDVMQGVSNQLPSVDQAVITMSFLAFGIFMANLVVQAVANGTNTFGREDSGSFPFDLSEIDLNRDLGLDNGLKDAADVLSEVYVGLHEMAELGVNHFVSALGMEAPKSRAPPGGEDLSPDCLRLLLCEGHRITSEQFKKSTSYRMLPFWTVGVSWFLGETNVPRLLEELRAEVAGQSGLECPALYPQCDDLDTVSRIVDKMVSQFDVTERRMGEVGEIGSSQVGGKHVDSTDQNSEVSDTER